MRVRGTMPEVLPVEVNIDTVYVRTNVKKVETQDFTGWEYDEEQYGKDVFITLMKKENTLLIAQNKANDVRADFLEELIVEMAMIVYS